MKPFNKYVNVFLWVALFFSFSPQINAQSSGKNSVKTLSKVREMRSKIEKASIKADTLSLARAHYKLGKLFDYSGEHDSSLFHYNAALKFAKAINNIKAEAVISNSLASLYSNDGEHKKAISLFFKSRSKFLSINDTTAAADITLNVADEYSDLGNYKLALQNALYALILRVKSGDSTNIAAYYLKLAGINNALRNRARWKENILKAEKLSRRKKYANFYTKMGILNELGAIYLWENKPDSAEVFWDSLYNRSKNANYVRGIAAALNNKIPLLTDKGKYKEALIRANEAFEINKKQNNIYGLIFTSLQKGKLYRLLGKNKSAGKNLLYTIKLAKEYKYPEDLYSAYKEIALLNAHRKRYKKAYEYYLKSAALKDSIADLELRKQISELQTKYQTAEKQAKINKLREENLKKETEIAESRGKIIAIISIALFLIVVIVLLYFQNRLNSKNRILNLQQKLLQTQMNPHFLFNSLIAIQAYVLQNKKLEASNYLSQYASLMRLILESSREEFIVLSREIEIIKNYVSLQQLRFEKSFHFQLQVDEKIRTDEINIPPMILQPLIENAIEHGLREIKEGEKILTVSYLIKEKKLIVAVEDNGVGISSARKESGKNGKKSYAMEITKERLMNITKLFGIKIELSIVDLSSFDGKTGTRIELGFPLNKIMRI